MIRIVSWNMNYWPKPKTQRTAAWDYLKALNPDFALLQETVPLDKLEPTHRVYRPIGNGRSWGSAVVSFTGPINEILEARSPYGSEPATMHRTYPRCLAVAVCESGLTLISVYGLIENGYALTTVHKLLSDLTPLFDSPLGRAVVLAGDLNVTTQFKEPHQSRHRNFLERLETLGLIDALDLQRPPRERLVGCPCGDVKCRHVWTNHHEGSTVLWQNDYFFISKALSARVKACYPIDYGSEIAYSLGKERPPLFGLAGVGEEMTNIMARFAKALRPHIKALQPKKTENYEQRRLLFI